MIDKLRTKNLQDITFYSTTETRDANTGRITKSNGTAIGTCKCIVYQVSGNEREISEKLKNFVEIGIIIDYPSFTLVDKMKAQINNEWYYLTKGDNVGLLNKTVQFFGGKNEFG